MNNKYLGMIALSFALLSSETIQANDIPSTQKTEQIQEDKTSKEKALFNQNAEYLINNLMPYLESQNVEGYYSFAYKDPVYLTAGIGTKFKIGTAKIVNTSKANTNADDIIITGEVMLDQVPFRHKKNGKELSYTEKVTYIQKVNALNMGRGFDGYQKHLDLAQNEEIILNLEDARKLTYGELRYKIKRIHKLLMQRHKIDLFKEPLGVQMLLCDTSFMAGEFGMLKYKNMLTHIKRKDYSKLERQTDCGPNIGRNNMRKAIASLVRYEQTKKEKYLEKGKQTFEKYNVELPLVALIKSEQNAIANINGFIKQSPQEKNQIYTPSSGLIQAHNFNPILLQRDDFFASTNFTNIRLLMENIEAFSLQKNWKSGDTLVQVSLDKKQNLNQSKQDYKKPKSNRSTRG